MRNFDFKKLNLPDSCAVMEEKMEKITRMICRPQTWFGG